MRLRLVPLPTPTVRALQAGGLDAYGHPPERRWAEGSGNLCRHCLGMVPEGAEMLVLAFQPFPAPQPYAETGPIFLCADPCEAGGGEVENGDELPAVLASPAYIVRGYGPDHRIVYGTGAVVPTGALLAEAATRLTDPRVAYLHVRSAQNNCYQLRIEQA